jgi:hypothetical protein
LFDEEFAGGSAFGGVITGHRVASGLAAAGEMITHNLQLKVVKIIRENDHYRIFENCEEEREREREREREKEREREREREEKMLKTKISKI